LDVCSSSLRVLSLRADQLVLLILVLALTVKFTFFDDRDHETVAKSTSMQNIQTRVSFNRAHSPLAAGATAMASIPSKEISTIDNGKVNVARCFNYPA
jgi:nitrate reductase gamma subunit